MQADAQGLIGTTHTTSPQPLLRLTSGVLVLFMAFGVASWTCGWACWIGFYLGARGAALINLTNAATTLGFVACIAGVMGWYAARCRRGMREISWRMVLAACLTLPVGNICWAIFVDATAWHYGRDLVRPAFDHAIMYILFASTVPLMVGVPVWSAVCTRRLHTISRGGVKKR